MPSIDKLKVGLVYADQYSKYDTLSTVADNSIFLVKDTGIYVGQNAIANYVNKDELLTISDASVTYQPKGNYALQSYVDETFARKPVVIYETDGTTGLLGINATTISNNWQLQNLDLSPYSYIKCYFKEADFSASSVYLTPAMVVVVPLDEASLSKAVGDSSPSGKVPCDMYIGGNTATNPNDPDVHIAMIVAVSNDKTKLQVVQQNSIAGTINGDRNNNGRYLYKIEGYYEDPSEAISGSTPTPVAETDPTVPAYVKAITLTDISTWNHKVDAADLAEVAFNGDYDYLTNRPTIPNELADLEDDTTHRVVTDASIDDWNSKTSNEGTITGIILNSSNMGTSGVIDLGTVLTEHQSLDDYYMKSTLDASFVKWDETYLNLGNIHQIDVDRIEFTNNNERYYIHLTNVGFVLEQASTSDLEWKIPFTNGDSKTVAFTSNIPTSLSQLTNDSGYALDASVVNLNKVPYVTETAAANVTIEPYKMYDFGTVSISMAIAFDTTKEVTGYTKEYIIRFIAGTGCVVSLPNGILYANGAIPTYIAGHTYEINIVNGCAVVAEFY